MSRVLSAVSLSVAFGLGFGVAQLCAEVEPQPVSAPISAAQPSLPVSAVASDPAVMRALHEQGRQLHRIEAALAERSILAQREGEPERAERPALTAESERLDAEEAGYLILDAAFVEGHWTTHDAVALREAMAQMSSEGRDAVLAELTRAFNAGELVWDGEGIPL